MSREISKALNGKCSKAVTTGVLIQAPSGLDRSHEVSGNVRSNFIPPSDDESDERILNQVSFVGMDDSNVVSCFTCV